MSHPDDWQERGELALEAGVSERSAVLLDPNDPIDKVLIEIHNLNRRKRNDYAEDSDPFSNFRRSADQVKDPAGVSVEILIATKQARLRELLWSTKEAMNESTRDTLLDRAVYSCIGVALFDEGAYEGGR